MHWWHCPGPAAFVDSVVGDIRAGCNLLLRSPSDSPEGLDNALRDSLKDSHLTWSRIDPSDIVDGDVSPAELLNDVAGFLPGDTRPTAERLAMADSEEHHVFWVQTEDPAIVPVWTQFIEAYSHACQNRPEIERNLVLLHVRTDEASDFHQGLVCLKYHELFDVSDKLDMQLYVARQLSGIQESRFIRELRIAIVSELSLWDPQLALYLKDLSFSQLTDPINVLRDFPGNENVKILGLPNGNPKQRRFQGVEMKHSVTAARAGERKEIEKRIWRAQVPILLPLIESGRHALAGKYERLIRLPIQTAFGCIDTIDDLEIGPLAHQLVQHPATDPRDREQLVLLRKARNHLAHVEPVPARLVMQLVGVG
jgi:hypothetical protein